MDGLAKGYAAKPVLFLQYETNSPHAANRLNRFMAAWDIEKNPRDIKPETPYTMVDSGQRISWGDRDFETEYRKMIEHELARPPLAILTAVRERPDTSTLVVKVQVTNISTSTLETAANSATVHVLLFQGNRALKAGTEIKASNIAFFDEPLVPGDTRRFEFKFSGLRGVNLSALEAAVLLDYMPSDTSGRWDMLQATIASSGRLPPVPTSLPSPTTIPTEAPTEVPPPTPTVAATVEPTPDPAASPQHYGIYLPLSMRRLSYQ